MGVRRDHIARQFDARSTAVAAEWIGLCGPVQVAARARKPIEIMLGRFVVLERGQNLLRQRCDPLLDLGERLLQLLLTRGVCRELELALHLGPRKTERFDLPYALRVGTLSILAGLASFLFSFFHALGKAGFRVDEPFSGITHGFDYPR